MRPPQYFQYFQNYKAGEKSAMLRDNVLSSNKREGGFRCKVLMRM